LLARSLDRCLPASPRCAQLLALEGEINAKIDELVAGIGALLREDSLGQAKDLTAKLKYYDNILKEIIRQK